MADADARTCRWRSGETSSSRASRPRRFLRIVAGEIRPVHARAAAGSNWRSRRQHPDNPLTARVIVNRVWHWHFGQALVRTPSNFGTLGEKPTHPELLDWLARPFTSHSGGGLRWSLKELHRLIVSSARLSDGQRP